MLKDYKISEPFFEYGPKCYMYGETLLNMAKGLDALSAKYNVDVILDVPDTEIYNIAKNTSKIHVYSQHMDSIPVGRGMGRSLPEALKAAGAVGVMLNHAEHKLTLDEIERAIRRAEEVGLATMVCADSIEEVKAIAKLAPDILVAEPTELIGTGKPADKAYVDEVIRVIREINPLIRPFPSAGISKGEDCYNIIKAGSATGLSSLSNRRRERRCRLKTRFFPRLTKPIVASALCDRHRNKFGVCMIFASGGFAGLILMCFLYGAGIAVALVVSVCILFCIRGVTQTVCGYFPLIMKDRINSGVSSLMMNASACVGAALIPLLTGLVMDKSGWGRIIFLLSLLPPYC